LSNRFPAARITRAQATIDAPARAADLAVEVDSGPEFRFGRLEVSGLQRYPPSVVENLNTIRAGTLYSQRALAELQTRLYTVPYFAGVNVVVEPQAAVDPAALPIKVEITEAARRKIDLGGGYSTDTGLRVQGSYTDINLFERGWRWRSLARIETLEQRAESALTLPLRPDGWQDEYTVLFNRSNVRDFEVQSYSVNYKHAKTEGRIERGFTLLATVSREFPEGANVNLKQALVPGYTWRYRVFDDVLDPRRGYEIGWQVGGGAKALLSDQNFLRTFGRAVGILPLTAVDNVVLRLEGGVVFAPSRDGIPAALLFRAGGDQSLRGYKYQSIGVTEGQAIVGGRYLVLGGAEYVRWLAPKWGAAVFIEAGDAFDERTALKLKRGYGVGARWRSPVGPINFDIAYGEAANSLRVHFSIGFVF
jgi:translocation and assembly module TamA